MWFFGFSTTNPKSIWIFSVILIVILVTIFFRRWVVRLESPGGGGDHHVSNSSKLSAAQSTDNCDKSREKCKNNASCNCWPSTTGVIRTYALEELKLATRDFRIRIGVGATSYVYLAELGDGRFGAVKRVMEERGGSKKIFLDEVSVLLRISHPNLVGLLGFCLEKGEQLLLLEYVPNKSLFDRLHTRSGQSLGVLSWSNRLSIAIDIAEALDYLHSTADPPVIHRDIKSSNILLIDDNHAKLADFGLCKLGHDVAAAARTPTTIRGSLGYVDTNYLATGCVSPKSDVYSFGVLLLELVTGLKSLQGSATLPEWTAEARERGDLEALVDPKLRGEVNAEQLRVVMEVANLALLENSEARPDMGQVLDWISRCYTEPQLSPELPV